MPVALKGEALDGTLRLVPDRPAVLVGDTFQVRVIAEGLRPFVSIDLRIRYDPARLQVLDADGVAAGTQIVSGPFPPPDRTVPWLNDVDAAAGMVSYAVVLDGPVPESGSGTVAVIPMRGLMPGEAEVWFDAAVVGSLHARRIPVALVDADIDVLGDAPETSTPGTPPTSPPGTTPPTVPPTATQPGPTAVTPPPTATQGPLPPTACVDVSQNGGFESGLDHWTIAGSPAPAAVLHPVLAGQRSLQLGHPAINARGTSAAWQGFDVPPWAAYITIGGWAWQRSTGPGGTDAQMLLLLDEDPASVPIAAEPAGTVFKQIVEAPSWRRWELTTGVRRFEAPRMWIYAAVANDGVGGRAWMTLDQVRVTLCP